MKRTHALMAVVMVVGGCTGDVMSPKGGGGVPGSMQASNPDPMNMGGTTGTPGPGGTTSPGAGPGSMTPAAPVSCDAPGAAVGGDTPLRRLTRSQYGNTVRDLFGAALGTDSAAKAKEIASRFPTDDHAGPFAANHSAAISDSHARLYLDAADQIAELVTRPETLPRLMPCTPKAGAEIVCVEQFIRTFGKRLFRRPVAAEIETGLKMVYNVGAGAGGLPNGMRLVLQAMLASPDFLYHVELKPKATGATVPLTGWELAARLSYFLWDSMPDDMLLAAAESGQLATTDGLRAQAQRLMNDAKARDAVTRFAVEWLGIDGVDSITRDTSHFPGFAPELPAAMKRDTIEFFDQTLRRGDGTLATLMTSSSSVVSDPVLRVYGVSRPFLQDAAKPLQLPKDQRAGVLTHASVLAATSHNDHTSPVKRGMFLLTNVLCHEIPIPEGLEIPQLPDPDPAKTTRERFAQHTQQPACAACHTIIDPMGFALERYDPIGAYRPKEGTKSIDETGIIAVGDPTLDGPVAGGVQLATKLSTSTKLRACVARQMRRFALGRIDTPADSCSMKALQEQFARSNHNVRDLMLGVVASDAFRLRPVGN